MKKFSIKDFVNYNSPCFNCGELINLRIVTGIAGEEVQLPTPIIKGDMIGIDLKHKYQSSISLIINGKTNKFQTNNMDAFKKYVSTLPLRLTSRCNKCCTFIRSHLLSFNYQKEFIYLTTIHNEILFLSTKDKKYCLTTISEENRSQLVLDKLDEKGKIITRSNMELPPLPLYKLKNKENFIKKIGIYLTFS